MRTLKYSPLLLLLMLVMVTGCVSQEEFNKLRSRNRNQAERISELSSQLAAVKAERNKLQRQLDDIRDTGGIEMQTLKNKINALERNLKQKNALINRMKKQLLSGAVLPVELNTMLEEFAKNNDMVTYDADKGMVKFKSDLLFDKGSAQVKSNATEAIKELCDVLQTDKGKQFDILIAGHTDNIPIQKPSTRAKHPTNWHLSAHRAISVLDVMKQSTVEPERMSARAFGEYRPVAPNKPDKGGNPKNRRVEIYIVPKGT